MRGRIFNIPSVKALSFQNNGTEQFSNANQSRSKIFALLFTFLSKHSFGCIYVSICHWTCCPTYPPNRKDREHRLKIAQSNWQRIGVSKAVDAPSINLLLPGITIEHCYYDGNYSSASTPRRKIVFINCTLFSRVQYLQRKNVSFSSLSSNDLSCATRT